MEDMLKDFMLGEHLLLVGNQVRIPILPSGTSCCPYYHRVLNLPRNKFQCCKLQQCVAQIIPKFYFCNKFFQLATLECVAWKVEHVVVIRATTLFNLQCNNVARQCKLKNKLNMSIFCFQGVGKNKIADRFLHLLNRPREYIQLHRCVVKCWFYARCPSLCYLPWFQRFSFFFAARFRRIAAQI